MATKSMRRAGESITKPSSDKLTGTRDINSNLKKIQELFDKFEPKDQLVCLEMLGVGSEYYTCQHCGKVKKKLDFYSSTAPNCKAGITDGCKQCAAEIAIPTVNGEKQQPTKKSVDDACYFLNKPMLDSVWDASLLEAANQATGKTKSNVWTSYIKNIAMQNYYTLTYRESDGYTGGIFSLNDMEENALPKDQEILEQFEKNKNDTLRLLGYLPFEKEKLSDQPFLYSQLIGFIDSDENGNDDMMRTSSIISIVRNFLQITQIDDMIAGFVQDPRNAEKNIPTIKALQEMKKNITMSTTKLAEENCISLKNSKNATKGENTWTGKTKKLKELNLREAQVNSFDIATCRGMQQAADICWSAIMKQLALDESEWADMVSQMREDIKKIRKERDSYKEINRILLQENLDLKDYMDENNIGSEIKKINLKDIYSVFSSEESEEVENDETDSSTI